MKEKNVQNPYNAYSRNQLGNAAPGEQIAALFDKAADHMAEAEKAISFGDVQARFNYSQKAMAIMEGLMACLNRDSPEKDKAAGDLAVYYQMMITMIGKVNIFNDQALCRSLENSFKDMAVFWRAAGKELAQKQNESINQESSVVA